MRKSTAESLSKDFLLKMNTYFQLFVTDFKLSYRLYMSRHNALYQLSETVLRDVLHESVLVFILISWEIL